jgi:hypothetical protein
MINKKGFIVMVLILVSVLLVKNVMAEKVFDPNMRSGYIKIDSSKKTVPQVRQGIGVQVSCDNLESSLKMVNVPFLKLTYEKKEHGNGWFVGAGFGLGESLMSEHMMIGSETESVVFNKLSTITIGGGFQGFNPFYYSVGMDLIFHRNSETNSGVNGYLFSGEIGHKVDIGDSCAIIPTVGVLFSFLSKATLNGKVGGLNQPVTGLGFRFGIKSIFWI